MKLVTVGDFILRVIHLVGEIKAKLKAIVDRLYEIQVLHKRWILSWVIKISSLA